MAGTTVTIRAKKKMLEARAGKRALPRIAGMAFGTGGVNSSGVIQPHSEISNTLHKEVLRKEIDGYTVVSDTKIRYACTLGTTELAGVEISEVGLYDSEGDMVAMKAFSKKGKDADMEAVFECDDTF